MKTPVKKVLLQISLFIVQFSRRCLKTPSWTSFIKNQPPTDVFEAFVNSLSRVPSFSFLIEYNNLTKVIAATLFSINNPFLTLAPKIV